MAAGGRGIRAVLIVGFAIVIALVILFLLGPREPVTGLARLGAADLGEDPEATIAAREAEFDDIRSGQQKEIIWRDPATKAPTEWAVVYLHGFSASKEEVRPLPDLVAEGLDANLFYARLTGHARGGPPMAEATADAWLADTAEALAVGERLGRRVLVIATSTGGTLAVWAALHEKLAKRFDALVLISPNFGVKGGAEILLNMPWGRQILPRVFGRSWKVEPRNPEYERAWTTRYPTVALLPMAATVKHVNALPFEEAHQPALFIHAPGDKVVRADRVRRVYARWGGEPKERIEVTNAEDPSQHVIAGRIVSPSQSEPLARRITDWVRGLK